MCDATGSVAIDRFKERSGNDRSTADPAKASSLSSPSDEII
jgi:hypothetical protein